MKRIFHICFLGIFSLLLSGCGASEETEGENQNLDTSDTQTSFFLTLPEDWYTIDAKTYSRNIVFAAREPSQGNDIDTLIVVSQENDTPYSMTDFVRTSLEQVRKSSQDFQKVSEEQVELSTGEKAVLVLYTDRNSLDMSSLGFYSLYVLSEQKSSVVTILFDPLTSDGHKEFLRHIIQTYNPVGSAQR